MLYKLELKKELLISKIQWIQTLKRTLAVILNGQYRVTFTCDKNWKIPRSLM